MKLSGWKPDLREQLKVAEKILFPHLQEGRCRWKACPYPSTSLSGLCKRHAEFFISGGCSSWNFQPTGEPEPQPYTPKDPTLEEILRGKIIPPAFTGKRLSGCKCLLRCIEPNAAQCAIQKQRDVRKSGACCCPSHDGEFKISAKAERSEGQQLWETTERAAGPC